MVNKKEQHWNFLCSKINIFLGFFLFSLDSLNPYSKEWCNRHTKRYNKVCLMHHSLANLMHVKWFILKKCDRYYYTFIIVYAPRCLREFIVVEGGFLLSHPLTAHLYVAPSTANLPSPLSTPRLPKETIASIFSQSLNYNDPFVNHVQLHALKQGMNQHSCLVYSHVNFVDNFRQIRQIFVNNSSDC